jgi:redox-sensitive bicupin YhaK (pirin superfamily)
MPLNYTDLALATAATEYEVPYEDGKTYALAVKGGDVTIQRMSADSVKVDVANGPVLAGEEVEIKTQSITNKLYFTPTLNGTYIEFTKV